ncbi:hypothetical protein NRE95_005032 [Salmonella enterica]|nr:hypothetical protein [Salmonella enterica]
MTVVCQEHFPDKPPHILTLTGMTPGRDIPVEPSGETEIKAMTAPELVEPGGQYIERIAPEDNSPGRYKPDLSVTKGPSGELIYRRLSDDGMPVTAG